MKVMLNKRGRDTVIPFDIQAVVKAFIFIVDTNMGTCLWIKSNIHLEGYIKRKEIKSSIRIGLSRAKST